MRECPPAIELNRTRFNLFACEIFLELKPFQFCLIKTGGLIYLARMRIKKMLHAALLVTDLEKARAFYGGLLGLREKTRHSFNYSGAWYDLGDVELHLMVTDAKLPIAEERPQRDFHVAFEIEDFEETRRAIIGSGLAYREGRSGLAQLFVRDPDGNLIELQKRAE